MDKPLRNQLYNTVVKCRRLLEEDLTQQLEGSYGIHAGGTIEPLAGLSHLDAVGRAERQEIEAAIRHEEVVINRAAGTGKAARREAVARYLRESAFTLLNRLAALKLMKHPGRALIQPSLGQAEHSKGFAQFSMICPEAIRAEPDGGYRLYLELLFNDLGQTLTALFDCTLPTSILFPTQPCLQELLALLNDPALTPAWGEDETIGWIYQYFTPGELREEARKASSAPRNSYELSFRNQFYTPRYVVAFLVDNTLGRLWWQMRAGETALGEECRYLIRPPEVATEAQSTQRDNQNDVSDLGISGAKPESSVPPPEVATEAQSTQRDNQKNLSALCVSVAKRDPRTFRILDPAAGSGHFLLYCFDLLLTIYQEAYDDPEVGPALQADYPDREAFRRAVPELILSHNLHGIDIDLRACQIASLALWLRAQRTYAELGLKIRQRPRPPLPHIVCAEPMPGEYDLLGEFVRDLRPVVLGTMLRDIWQKMELAGEAGSLLKIEQEIQASIKNARQALLDLPAGIQLTLFGPAEPQQLPLQLNPAELKDEAFWAEAEERVRAALRTYARRVGDGRQITRRLFADDALQGMAFIDLLQQPFDVVLMNPPFGAASLGSKDYLSRAYPRTKNDLYAAFVERGLELLRPGGTLGAITSRTGFFLTSFQKWREEILLKEAHLIALADLGYGVLDTAMVETAAYVLEKRGGET